MNSHIEYNKRSNFLWRHCLNLNDFVVYFNTKIFKFLLQKKKPMETDDSTTIKTEPPSQTSTTSSTPVPTSAITPLSQTGTTTTTVTAPTKTKLPSIVLPEVDLYLHLLVLLFAIDRQKYKQVERLNKNYESNLGNFKPILQYISANFYSAYIKYLGFFCFKSEFGFWPPLPK